MCEDSLRKQEVPCLDLVMPRGVVRLLQPVVADRPGLSQVASAQAPL